MAIPGASHSFTLRLKLKNRIGMIGQATSAIGRAGGDIGSIDIVHVKPNQVIRDIVVNARDETHVDEIVEAVRKIKGIHIVDVSDRTFLIHQGGKIEIANKIPLHTRDDLSRVYTPGVARVSMAIYREPEKAYTLTIKKNSVAVVTDGSAVLGLGNLGPEAAMPVMEGKAMLFKEFAGIDAFPICLATQDPKEIVETIIRISPCFGGIHLEDISSPRCFEVERRLKEALEIPIFHDDQHGTAVVVLAALLNAVKVVKKPLSRLKVVVCGTGAAGIATIDILLSAGVQEIIGCDRVGILHPGRRTGMNPIKLQYARRTNPLKRKGTLEDALEGADLFIGLSSPGILHPSALKKMASDPIIFALANPTPEIMPEEIEGKARIIATGRSDYPNQINNVLAFPGIFRGCLDVRALEINQEMKLAAAHAIASVISKDALSEDYIVPAVFNRKVARMVAQAVIKAAIKTGVVRKRKTP